MCIGECIGICVCVLLRTYICWYLSVCVLAMQQLCNNFRFDKGPWRQVESFRRQRGVACVARWQRGGAANANANATATFATRIALGTEHTPHSLQRFKIQKHIGNATATAANVFRKSFPLYGNSCWNCRR